MFHIWILVISQIFFIHTFLLVLVINCTNKRSNRIAGSEPNSDGRSDPAASCQPSAVLGQTPHQPSGTATAATPTAASARAVAPPPSTPKPMQPPSESKPDVVQIIVVDPVQKSPKGLNQQQPDTDKLVQSPKQSSVKETKTSAKDTKETRSTKEQATGAGRTEGSARPRKFEPRNEAERKQLEDIKKGKFGNTIEDDTMNDADFEWGEGDVNFKADRTKKKKKRR